MWKTKEAKCVVGLSQSINNIKGVGESKCFHGIIVYICLYIFFVFVYINTLDFYNFHAAIVSCLISPMSLALGQLTTYKPMIMKKNLARWSQTQFLNFLNFNK